MTPLQRVAMGLVIVVVDPTFGAWDGLPDVLGWMLVIWGLRTLGERLLDHGTLLGTATAAGVVSVALFVPAFTDLLAPTAQWAFSLPQAVFAVLLCRSLAAAVTPGERLGVQPRRFTVLCWVFVVLAVAPAVVLGGGVEGLEAPVALAAVAAYAVLVWSLFALSLRPEFGADADQTTSSGSTDSS